MVDPMPTLVGTEAADLEALFNGHSSAVDFRLEQTIAEIQGLAREDTVEDLNARTGNTVGQVVYVIDVQRLYVCTALPSTWVRWDQLGWAEVEPTLGAGWTDVDHKRLRRRGGFAYLQFNAARTSSLPTDGVLCEIPAGYRGDDKNWGSAWHVSNPGKFFQVYYDVSLHKILTQETIPDSAGVALSMMWPLI